MIRYVMMTMVDDDDGGRRALARYGQSRRAG